MAIKKKPPIRMIIAVSASVVFLAAASFFFLKNWTAGEKEKGVMVFSEPVKYYGPADGFLAYPAMGGKYPGVIMIHEWWGLNGGIKNQARELAKEGYIVLAVDLFKGEVASTPEKARELMGKVVKEEALQNMEVAADYLRSRGATKIASLGWCFGGGKSLELALSGIDLDATVLYYGQLETDAEKLKAINWPVLGIFGGEDSSIPVHSVREFESALDSLGIQNEIYVYPGVAHAFANPSGDNYHPAEAEDAWAKTVSFLERYLSD